MVVNVASLRAQKKWRPFSFNHLPKVSRAEVTLLSRLEWIAPLAGSAQGLPEALGERFRDLFDQPVRMRLDTVLAMRTRDLKRVIPDPTVLCVLSFSPQRTRLLLEIDLTLAHAAVDLLLGGAGEQVAARPLTDIEEGVVGYVVLELLKVLGPTLEPGLPRLTLEGFARNTDEALATLGEETHTVAVQFKASLGQKVGWVRAFLPGTLLSAAFPPAASDELRARRLEGFTSSVHRFSHVRTSLWAQIGFAEIMEGDLLGLRNGDVILLDELTARPERGEGGTAKLRVGRGRSGWAAADVALTDGRFCATITSLHRDEPSPIQPLESEAVDAPANAAYEESTHPGPSGSNESARNSEKETKNVDESRAEGGDLLNDVPLQISVEMARLPVSAEQIVGLRVGQVLELDRVPGDPVDLSVNGKVIARGELVEVEGQLGVRVLNLAT